MKIALAGFLHNNASTILHWLAWHQQLGVDSFILLDDDSDDGTRDLVTAAALHQNIQLYHLRDTAIRAGDTDAARGRLKTLYQDIVAGLQGQCDWVGLLSPEYCLHLPHHASLPDCLALAGDDVSEIGLSLPADAGTDRERSPHGMSPCFLRPERWQAADASAGPSVFLQRERSGEDALVWPSALPCPANPEQDSISLSPAAQDRAGPVPGRVGAAMALSALSGMQARLEAMRQAYPAPAEPLSFLPRKTLKHGTIHALHNEAGQAINPHGSPERNGQDEGETGNSRLMVFQSHANPETAFLFAQNDDDSIAPLALAGEERVAGLLAYDILPVQDRASMALRTQAMQRPSGERLFLSCPENGPLKIGPAQAGPEEFFLLSPQAQTPSGRSWLALAVFQLADIMLDQPVTLPHLSRLLELDRRSTSWLLPLLASRLSPQDNDILRSFLGPFARFCL